MKPALVLLPGLNGTDGLFAPLVSAMSADINVIKISYPTQEKASYSELTSMVSERVNAIDGSYILLGESFSGPISLFVAAKKPEGLLGVILVASFITAPNLRLGRFLPWTLGFSLTRPLYRLRLACSNSGNYQFIKAISTELQKVKPGVLSHRIQQIFAVDASTALANCSVPLVYFRGTKDIVVPVGNLQKILSVRPDVKIVEFNTQHFLLQSKPGQALAEIEIFIRSCQ